MHKAGRGLATMLLGLALGGHAIAQDRAGGLHPVAASLTLDRFLLEGGQTIAPLRLHYLTLGTPHRDARGHVTNAVLLLHGTTGSAAQFLGSDMALLYAPGQPLDLGRWFLVIPDGIGAGGSSKPSDGLCGRFPRYGYRDQNAVSHLLLARLGVLRERLVLGTSMGGMQSWLWAETYPQETDAVVAVASTPAPITGRNLLWREMTMRAITSDPDWHDGHPDPAHKPTEWTVTVAPLFAILTQDVGRLQAQIPDRPAAAADLDRLIDKQARTVSPCDVLFQFDSSFDYDPRPGLDRIAMPFLSINFADDLLNPPELLRLPQRPNMHALMVSATDSLYGHETLNHPAGWIDGLRRFLATLPGWGAA